MAYLLDTCVLSEVWRPAPNSGVLRWLGEAVEDDLLLSALTLGEIRKGIAGLAEGRKKERLSRDCAAIKSRFAARILPVTAAVAERWGELSARARKVGRALHVVDGLLAATASVHDLTLVTRNTADFEVARLPIVNPWRD